jgi:hypothetical protein
MLSSKFVHSLCLQLVTRKRCKEALRDQQASNKKAARKVLRTAFK